jgi:YggT family protein
MAWIVLFYTLELFKWLILARALMSWFVSPGSHHPAARLLRRLTDPVLRPLAGMLPPMGGVDLTPIIAFVAIMLLQQVILRVA